MTVSWKLEQSDWRTDVAGRPSRVPVMARLQLLPAQLRASKTLMPAKATETNERTAKTFMVAGFCSYFFFGLFPKGRRKRSIEIGNWTERDGMEKQKRGLALEMVLSGVDPQAERIQVQAEGVGRGRDARYIYLPLGSSCHVSTRLGVYEHTRIFRAYDNTK